MSISGPSLTTAIICRDSCIWFSAYQFGWGYGAYALPGTIVCSLLGAADTTPPQLLLAFELGTQKILRAVTRRGPAASGERVYLDACDFHFEQTVSPDSIAEVAISSAG